MEGFKGSHLQGTTSLLPTFHQPGHSPVATASTREAGKQTPAVCQEERERAWGGAQGVCPCEAMSAAPSKLSSKFRVSDPHTLPPLRQLQDGNQNLRWPDVTWDVGCGKQKPRLKSNGLIH